MSRAVVAIMAGLLCTLAGLKHAAALKGDAARLARWEQLLAHLAVLLREGTLSIPKALCAAADSTHPADHLLQEIARKLASSPLSSVANIFSALCPDWIEKPTLSRYFAKLGHGSRNNRILAAEQCRDEMRLLAKSAAEKAEKDAKLWQTLGLTGGICLTILIL